MTRSIFHKTYIEQCRMPSKLPCYRCIVVVLWQDLAWFEGKTGILCTLLLFEQGQECKTWRRNAKEVPGSWKLKVNWNTRMIIRLDDTSVCQHRANTENEKKCYETSGESEHISSNKNYTLSWVLKIYWSCRKQLFLLSYFYSYLLPIIFWQKENKRIEKLSFELFCKYTLKLNLKIFC